MKIDTTMANNSIEIKTEENNKIPMVANIENNNKHEVYNNDNRITIIAERNKNKEKACQSDTNITIELLFIVGILEENPYDCNKKSNNNLFRLTNHE